MTVQTRVSAVASQMGRGVVPRSMFEKIWECHLIVERGDGQCLLFVDRHLANDGSFQAFLKLAEAGRSVRRPDLTFASADHYAPTNGRSLDDLERDDARVVIRSFENNMRSAGVTAFGLDDARQGIVHVVGPEQGWTLPGVLLVCGDSHTSTHGALGALAFGIGASEVAHVLATQTLWQTRPKTMRITIDGTLPLGVTAKDLALAIIATIGTAGAAGHAVEYAGAVVTGLTIEERMTLCNMSIEAGGRSGMIAPDDKTLAFIEGRPFAPSGAEWDAAVAAWRTLPSDPGARYDTEITLSGDDIAPMVTWGTSPEDALAITEHVPDPKQISDPERSAAVERALAYMGLTAGTALSDITIDLVFIGSCANSRIEDLRAAAAIARGRTAVVPALVAPGSTQVKQQAETEGLDHIFRDAGFTWGESSCSMCVGSNGDLVKPGQRCASTSNRNFAGRQGPGARTHLLSPAMAAAAAITGHLTDVRHLTR